jgi:hypothetical protein
MKPLTTRVLAALSLSAATTAAPAQTRETVGSGTAVTAIDRAADFNRLGSNGIALSDYTGGGALHRHRRRQLGRGGPPPL